MGARVPKHMKKVKKVRFAGLSHLLPAWYHVVGCTADESIKK
jgi:hypothetical protein